VSSTKDEINFKYLCKSLFEHYWRDKISSDDFLIKEGCMHGLERGGLISRAYVFENNEFEIYYALDLNNTEKTVCMVHEFGHLLMHLEILKKFGLIYEKKYELEANDLARAFIENRHTYYYVEGIISYTYASKKNNYEAALELLVPPYAS